MLKACLALLLIAVAVALPFTPNAEDIVETNSGTVQGLLFDGHRAFLGIPYIAPPVGDLRWAMPVHNTWNGTLVTQAYGPGCPQICNLPPHICPEEQSEDCVTLNIFTPRVSALNGPAPVMMWFPGGHFEQGTAGCQLFDGTTLAEKYGVVLVNVNYRLGALGWVHFGTMEGDGNFGFHDQRMAMKWVADNIAAFGGDPSRVTIAGQSAGATSIAAHLVSPKSDGLYSGAIMMSDPLTLGLRDSKMASKIGAKFTESLGCKNTDVDCLRKASLDDILSAQHIAGGYLPISQPLVLFYPWTPVMNGQDPPQEPMTALPAGKFSRVPLMLGSVHNEADIFIGQAVAKPVSEFVYDLGIAALFKLKAAGVIHNYHPTDKAAKEDTRPLLSKEGTDLLFTCANRMVAQHTSVEGVPTYIYTFSHSNSFKESWGPHYPECQPDNITCHGGDISYVFDTAKLMYNLTAEEQALSDRMSAYFANFVHSGDPNTGTQDGLLEWPAYASEKDLRMNFYAGTDKVGSSPDTEHCDFWNKEGFVV